MCIESVQKLFYRTDQTQRSQKKKVFSSIPKLAFLDVKLSTCKTTNLLLVLATLIIKYQFLRLTLNTTFFQSIIFFVNQKKNNHNYFFFHLIFFFFSQFEAIGRRNNRKNESRGLKKKIKNLENKVSFVYGILNQ